MSDCIKQHDARELNLASVAFAETFRHSAGLHGVALQLREPFSDSRETTPFIVELQSSEYCQ